MTLKSDLESLWHTLHELRNDVLALRLLVIEDRPESWAPQPVHALADAVDDIVGLLQEAIEAAAATMQATGQLRACVELAARLGLCHDRMIEVGRRWVSNVSSHHQLSQLTTAARERGPRWQAWARQVVDAVASCAEPLSEVHTAALRCWEQLAERADPPELSSCSTAATKER